MALPMLRVLLAGLVLTVLVTPRGAASAHVEAGEHAVAAAPGAELPATTRAGEAQWIAAAEAVHTARPALVRKASAAPIVANVERPRADGHRPMPREYLPRRLLPRSGDDGDDH